MKLAVFSDSHGANCQVQAMMKALRKESAVDALLFAGDGIHDALDLGTAFKRVLAVRGNCDFSCPPGIPDEINEMLSGVRVYLIHGHQYRVKSTLSLLACRVCEVGAQVCVYGHSHQQDFSYISNVLCLNPGALRNGEYALLHIGQNGRVRPEMRCV